MVLSKGGGMVPDSCNDSVNALHAVCQRSALERRRSKRQQFIAGQIDIGQCSKAVHARHRSPHPGARLGGQQQIATSSRHVQVFWLWYQS